MKDTTETNSLATVTLDSVWSNSGFQSYLSERGLGFFLLDENATILDANDSACEMVDFQQYELRQKPLVDLFAPQQKQVLPEGQEALEQCYLTKFNTELWVEVRLWPLSADKTEEKLSLLVLENITNTKNTFNGIEKVKQSLHESIGRVPTRISYVDSDFCYKYINDAFEDYYKVKKSEFLGRKIYDVIPAAAWSITQERLNQAFAGKKVSYQGPLLDSGQQGNVWIEFIPEFDKDSMIVGVFIMASDISELRVAEEYLKVSNDQLRKSEENFRNMMESSIDGVIVVNFDGEIVYSNSTITELFGYSINEIVGLNLEELLPEILRERHVKMREGFQNSSHAVIKNNIELVGRTKQGGHIPIEIGLGETLFNNKPAIIANIRDASISRAEQNSTQELAAILEASSDGVFRTNLSGIIQFWSHGAESLYGYTADEIVGQQVDVLIDDRYTSDGDNILGTILNDENVVRENEHRKHKLGHTVEVSISVYPIKDTKGLVVGAASVHRDNGEIIHLEEQLRHSQRMEIAGQLAGGLAHDFNNILTVMHGYCALLKEDLPKSGKSLNYLAAIDGATQRASSLTRQLLAFSRKQKFSPEVIEPNKLISELGTILTGTLGEDVDLTIDLASTWSVFEDPAQLEQIVLNLTINAKHALEHGGSLSIFSKNVLLSPLSIKTTPGMTSFAPQPLQAGRYVQLTISDTGSGMNKTVLERIFEPFYTTKPKDKGTGLGLSVVFGMIAQSGGSILVESCKGKGTNFHIYLPTAEGKIKVEKATISPIPKGVGKILIVEDDEGLLFLTKTILTAAGYTVYTASEPAEVLDGGFNQDIDLILSDVVMPGLNGPDFITKWLELKPNTRFLFMSGYADDSMVPCTFDSNQLIQKPFKAFDLVNRVNAVINAVPNPMVVASSVSDKQVKAIENSESWL